MKEIDQALIHHQAGRLNQAEALYRHVLGAAPNHPDALHLLGVLAHQRGDHEGAVVNIEQAITLRANVADYHSNLGEALRALGELDRAIVAYRQAIALRPNHPHAHNNLGLALQAQGKFIEAAATFRQALALRPNAETLCNLGNALRESANLEEAIAAYRQAVALEPNFAEAYNNLGAALRQQGRHVDAIDALKRAHMLDPDYAEACYNLAVTLEEQEQWSEAIDFYRHALSLNPELEEAHYRLGRLLHELRRYDEALAAYRRALALKPDDADTFTLLGSVLYRRGEHDAAITALRKALSLDPDHSRAHSTLILVMQYHPNIGLESLFGETRGWNAQHAAPLQGEWRPHDNIPDPRRRLRLGYVSADFCAHPVGFFLAPVMTRRNRDQFEVFCYSSTPRADELTARFRAEADHWRESMRLSDAELAEQIRDDRIDILVDLSGHTGGHRLLTFARKPAPVQLTAGGHNSTTGLDAIDYLIADRFHAPKGAERYFSEALIRMPHDYICYGPPSDAPAAAEAPLRRRGYVTFGCYNNLAKLNPQVVALWAEVLRALPSSRLRLQTFGLNDAGTAAQVKEMFTNCGITAARLELAGQKPHKQLLAAYGEIDIALDPFPYSGGLTTCEALWMGVPVVTLTGQAFCGRHSTSHLHNAGLPELVAATAEDYVRLAVTLAQNTEHLLTLRAGLRAQMAASPLCDAERYTRDLEAAYRGIWEKYCEVSGK